MNRKEMLNDLDTIDSYLNTFVSKAVDNPLRLSIYRLRNQIDLISPGSFIEKKKLFDIIDKVIDHYISNVQTYGDILANYDKDCSFELLDNFVNVSKGLFSKIDETLKDSINVYYKSKE